MQSYDLGIYEKMMVCWQNREETTTEIISTRGNVIPTTEEHPKSPWSNLVLFLTPFLGLKAQ